MTSFQQREIDRQQRQYETRDRLDQAAREAAALAGLLGVEAQLLAMSEQYKALKAAGDDDAATAVRRAAAAIYATLEGDRHAH